MNGIFCSIQAKTNEEYKIVIKKRMKLMAGISIIGVLTALLGFGAEYMIQIPINEHMLGVYSGVGVGLAVSGCIIWIKHKLLLGNEEKLKESRIHSSDERLAEIGNKAIRTAAFVLFAGLYVMGLVGGLFYPVLVNMLLVLVSLFILAYSVSYFYYSKTM